MLLNKVAPMPHRSTKPETIRPMARLDAGIPRPVEVTRLLGGKALLECKRLVDVLLECEIEPELYDCEPEEWPVAKEWLTRIRYNEASKLGLSLVLPRVMKYMSKWSAVIMAAEYNEDAHALVVLVAQDLGLWESTMHYEAPASEYKDTRYMQDVTERDEDEGEE